MQQKRDGLAKPAKASKGELFKCNECLHFKQSPHRSNKSILCSDLGIRGFAVAPPCYTPDYTKVISTSQNLVTLSTVFANLTAHQRKILLGMLRVIPNGKKYKLGEKIFLKTSTRDYLSNYVCGYVAGYTSSNELVLVGSPTLKKTGKVFYAYLKSDEGLLNHKQFLAKRKELIAANKVLDPKFTKARDITALPDVETYEVPTIDNAPKEPAPVKKSIRTTPVYELIEVGSKR